MREDFYENSVGPQKEKSQRIFYKFYTALFVLAIISFVLFLIIWSWVGDTGFVVLFAFSAIFAVVCFLVRRRLLTYFDYTFVSGEIRIIKVINGKTRRKFLIFDSKSIDQIGKVGSNSFEKLLNSPGYKVKMATPNGYNAEKQLYNVAATIDGIKQIVILECEEKFLTFIVAHRGRNVIEKDYE